MDRGVVPDMASSTNRMGRTTNPELAQYGIMKAGASGQKAHVRSYEEVAVDGLDAHKTCIYLMKAIEGKQISP